MEKIHYSRKEYRSEYLKSDHWRQFRRHILDRDRDCRICNQARSYDAHHLTYDRIHNESEDDVIGICRPCHAFIHSKKELSHISNIQLLRKLVKKSRKPVTIDEKTILLINAAPSHIKARLAGLLKIPAYKLELSLGKKVNFFLFHRISRLLQGKCPPPRKSKSKGPYSRSRVLKI